MDKNRIALIVVLVVMTVLWTFAFVFRAQHPEPYEWHSNNACCMGLPGDIVIAPDGAIYLENCNSIFKSVDDGKSWQKADNGIKKWRKTSDGIKSCSLNAIAVDSKGIIYAASECGIYRSTNRASSWVLVNTKMAGIVNKLFANSTGRLFANAWDCVYISCDSGMHWNRLVRKNSVTAFQYLIVQRDGECLSLSIRLEYTARLMVVIVGIR